MKRLRKILLWTLGVTAGLVLVAWLGLKAYLNSSHVRQQAGAQLSEMIGLPVEVDSLSVGTGSTSAGFHITDIGTKSGDLLKVGSIDTDVTLMQLITGAVAPTTVTVNDLELVLRIGGDGKVQSSLPKFKSGEGGSKTLPAVQLVNGRVRIHQDGHPDFDLGGISAKLARDGDKYALSGDVTDPKWGKWKLTGHVTADPAGGEIVLQSDEAPMQNQLLRSIPYVPGQVWDEVMPSGASAATVALAFRPDSGVGYAVDLKPQKAALSIPSIGATLAQVEGRVKVADGKVTFENGQGGLGAGQVKLDGAYDFTKPTGVLTMKVTAKGVDLQQLPPAWGLPKQITGKLRGTGDLEIHVPPAGRVETRGSGRGDIEDAKLAGIAATIKLKMAPGNGRYQFTTD